MQHHAIGDGGREWAFQATRPDYHLTLERPLWAESYWHPTAKNPVLSIHSGLEIGVVVSGWQEIELDGSQIPGNPGDVWLCAMSEPHRYRVVLPDTRNLVFIFLPSFFGEETLGEVSWLTLFAAPPRERPRVATAQMRHQVLMIAKELERTLAGARPLGRAERASQRAPLAES